jgi:hypothetical protein
LDSRGGNNSASFGHIQAFGAQVRGGDVSEAEWFWQPELRVDEVRRRSCQKPIQEIQDTSRVQAHRLRIHCRAYQRRVLCLLGIPGAQRHQLCYQARGDFRSHPT